MINFLREISRKEKILAQINSSSFIEHVKIFFGIKNPDMFYSGNLFWKIKESFRTHLTGWHRSLIWCPSQLQKEYTYGNYTVKLYARWRHTDPWTGYFIISKKSDTLLNKLLEIDTPETPSLWSEEVLSGFEYTEEDSISDIEKTMEELYQAYFIDKVKQLRFSR